MQLMAIKVNIAPVQLAIHKAEYIFQLSKSVNNIQIKFILAKIINSVDIVPLPFSKNYIYIEEESVDIYQFRNPLHSKGEVNQFPEHSYFGAK